VDQCQRPEEATVREWRIFESVPKNPSCPIHPHEPLRPGSDVTQIELIGGEVGHPERGDAPAGVLNRLDPLAQVRGYYGSATPRQSGVVELLAECQQHAGERLDEPEGSYEQAEDAVNLFDGHDIACRALNRLPLRTVARVSGHSFGTACRAARPSQLRPGARTVGLEVGRRPRRFRQRGRYPA
jgi:hypothetical protein